MISFVVPAYNEERLVGRTLEALRDAARAVAEPYELIVVDDGSVDETAAIADAKGARVVRVQFRHIARTRNAGAHAAVGAPFRSASGPAPPTARSPEDCQPKDRRRGSSSLLLSKQIGGPSSGSRRPCP
jgi:glycosyltransferase involved in cell wall biosynthesis